MAYPATRQLAPGALAFNSLASWEGVQFRDALLINLACQRAPSAPPKHAWTV